MNFLIRLRLCYPTFGCCRTHQYPSFARSAQTFSDRSSLVVGEMAVVELKVLRVLRALRALRRCRIGCAPAVLDRI